MTFFALAVMILFAFAVTFGVFQSNKRGNVGHVALVFVAIAVGCFLLSMILWNTRRPTVTSEVATTSVRSQTRRAAVVATMNAEHQAVTKVREETAPSDGTETPRGLTNEDIGEPRPLQNSITPPPSWMEPRRVDKGDTTLLVLSSQRWATREEALDDLQVLLVKTLKDDFQQHEAVELTPWRPTREQAEVAVREPPYVESYQQDLGTYVAVMYRAHMRIELSPSVRSNLRPIWRAQVVEGRLWAIGSIVAAVTMVFGIIALGLRLIPRMAGFQRVAVVFACLLVSTIGGATLVYWGRSVEATARPAELVSGDMESHSTRPPTRAPLPKRTLSPIPAKPVATKPANFFGVSTGTKRVAFVVEDSKSMQTSGALNMVQAELTRWCKSADKIPTEFIVVSYGEEVASTQLTTECSKGTSFLNSLHGPAIKTSDNLIEAIEQALVVQPEHIVIVRDASDPKFDMPDTAQIETLRASTSINYVELLPKDDFARPLNSQSLHALPFKVDAYQSIENVTTTEK